MSGSGGLGGRGGDGDGERIGDENRWRGSTNEVIRTRE